MTTFGVDFYRHLQDSNTEEENIPHIISSCIDEIDKRGMNLKLCKLKGVLIWRNVVPGGRVARELFIHFNINSCRRDLFT